MRAACGKLLRGLPEAGWLPGVGEAGVSHGFNHPYAAFDPLDRRTFEDFTMGYQGLPYVAKDPQTGEYDPGMKPHVDHREFIERALRGL